MPAPSRPGTTSASRYSLSIDGDEIGRFEVLMAATALRTPPRIIEAHELPSVWGHTGEIRSGKWSATDHGFAVPDKGPQRAGGTAITLVLKRGRARQTVLGRWRSFATAGRASRIVLSSLDAAGRPLARYDLGSARPGKITGATLDAKGGADVAIEELVIDHEGVRLEPPGSDRQRYHHKP
ncbi:MAG TPA: phage tail protein [Gammaproteobacteria bacterium]|nr:phage tail protein [Gammaproteobacteria bacterium]